MWSQNQVPDEKGEGCTGTWHAYRTGALTLRLRRYVYPPDHGYVRGCDEGFLPPGLDAAAFFDVEDVEPGHTLFTGA